MLEEVQTMLKAGEELQGLVLTVRACVLQDALTILKAGGKELLGLSTVRVFHACVLQKSADNAKSRR